MVAGVLASCYSLKYLCSYWHAITLELSRITNGNGGEQREIAPVGRQAEQLRGESKWFPVV